MTIVLMTFSLHLSVVTKYQFSCLHFFKIISLKRDEASLPFLYFELQKTSHTDKKIGQFAFSIWSRIYVAKQAKTNLVFSKIVKIRN